jgi:hypothetical protein
VSTTLLAISMPRQETRRLSRNEARLRAGQHGLSLLKRQSDLIELVIAFVEAGDHIIADDPDLDMNSHGHSEGSMADKLQPTCLPRRRPRHPTDFYALARDSVPKNLTEEIVPPAVGWAFTFLVQRRLGMAQLSQVGAS